MSGGAGFHERTVRLGPLVSWDRVDRLVDAAPTLEDLAAHRLLQIAARRQHALALPLSPELADQEFQASIAVITAPILLERIRSACEGIVLLVKGPELAARYPDPALRGYGDLDIVVPDALATQQALIEIGFVEVEVQRPVRGDYHLVPLEWPGLPLRVEVHHRPNWPRRLSPPPTEEFFAVAVPSICGVPGISTLPPAQHALVVAAHAWAHAPLARIGDLLDVALLAEGADRREIDVIAERWGMGKLWRTTIGAADAILWAGRPPSLAQRTWARHLAAVRERTVFESHLEDWLSALWALPIPRAVWAIAAEVASEGLPARGEPWSAKARRSRIALRHAFLRKSEHDRFLSTNQRNQDEEPKR